MKNGQPMGLRVLFEHSVDNDYANYRRAEVETQWASVHVHPDSMYAWRNVPWAERVPSDHVKIAERRPDGLWYLKRDWDAPGYDRFSLFSEVAE